VLYTECWKVLITYLCIYIVLAYPLLSLPIKHSHEISRLLALATYTHIQMDKLQYPEYDNAVGGASRGTNRAEKSSQFAEPTESESRLAEAFTASGPSVSLYEARYHY
jgi:hypothetical protein